ncbi:MAG: hypothetical protein IJW87_06085 [Clostridia bacterium]|nr:hypothetical protein [Clostridia bacterium]
MKRFKCLILLALSLLLLVSCEEKPKHITSCELSTGDVKENLYVGMSQSELLTAMGYSAQYGLLTNKDISSNMVTHYRWALTDGNILDMITKINDEAFGGINTDAFHVSEIKITTPSGDEVYRQLCRPLDLQNLPDGFWLSQAKDSGLVVHENGHVTAGQDSFSYFLEQTEKGIPDTVFLANYYTLLDPSNYDPSYYEEIKGDYPKLFISALTFDGEKYQHIQYENGEKIVATYAYLVQSYKPANPRRPHDTEGSTLVYMLSDAPDGSYYDWLVATTSSSVLIDRKRCWPIYTE